MSKNTWPKSTASRRSGAIYRTCCGKTAAKTRFLWCARTAAAALSRSIQEGSFVKEYLAQVHGQPPQWGDLQDLLWKDSRKNKVFVVRRQRSGVKDARLQYTRLTDGPDSLVHIRLYTGRSHQIRVQFASRGYPLVGRSGVKDARLQYTRLTDGPDSLVHIRLYTGRSHQIRVQFASRGYPLVGDHKYGARDSLTAPRLFSCRVQFPWRGKALCFEAIPDWAGLSALPAFPAEPTAD